MQDFDDIRPYTDSELPAALERIAKWELFPQVARFIYPGISASESVARLKSVSTVHQLQQTIMDDAIKRIIKTTTDGFTYSGLHHLRRNEAYLFVSNHRDITLDAFLLQHMLINHRDDTSHIVFGNNLIGSPIMADMFRCNKLIQMERGGNPMAFYRSLQHLSDYLRRLVVEEHQSVWIAQKNGRAKDGIDSTAPAMIKMLTLSHKDNPEEALADLHIVPVAISYEWDPCDAMKAAELYQTSRGEYHKAEGEDLRSVVTGIIGNKGHVHLAIGEPLHRRELKPPEGMSVTDHVATVLDKRIHRAYRMMPTNYVAYSMLTGRQMPLRYTREVKDRFIERLEALPHQKMRNIMLQAYAAPLMH